MTRLRNMNKLIVDLARIHGNMLSLKMMAPNITIDEVMDQMMYGRGLADQIERSLHPRRRDPITEDQNMKTKISDARPVYRIGDKVRVKESGELVTVIGKDEDDMWIKCQWTYGAAGVTEVFRYSEIEITR